MRYIGLLIVLKDLFYLKYYFSEIYK